MKIGIGLGRLNPSLWATATELADRLGYESVWMPEHLIFPASMSGSPVTGSTHPPVPPSTPVYDTFVFMGLLAGRTSKIRFGQNVYNVGLRHPFVTARAVATLDVISGGRVLFGIGASWLKEEWDATGLDFTTRGQRVNETLEICQRLWSEEVIEHHGALFDFGPVMFEPKPVQKPWPPILVGGDAPAALKRAARYGDGWLPMNHTLEALPAAIKRLAALRAAAGRDGRTEVTMDVEVKTRDDIARAAEAGLDRVIVSPWRRTSEALDGIKRFADEVLPSAA